MKKKYWLNGSKPWMFSTRVKDKKGKSRLYEVIRACHIGIVRHIKIRGDANPFDPKYDEYFRKRRFSKTYGHSARMAESFV
jgi:RNA-directed DNA polymerase